MEHSKKVPANSRHLSPVTTRRVMPASSLNLETILDNRSHLSSSFFHVNKSRQSVSSDVLKDELSSWIDQYNISEEAVEKLYDILANCEIAVDNGGVEQRKKNGQLISKIKELLELARQL